MSSRIGLWLSSSRSVSPRVPTVEYARSERSSAKSSQAARNSALSCARSSGHAPAPGGVELEECELDERAVGHERRLVATALAAGLLVCGWPAQAHAQTVTVAVLPPDTTSTELAAVPQVCRVGVMSAGIGEVPEEQPTSTSPRGTGSTTSLYDRPLPPLPNFLPSPQLARSSTGRGGAPPRSSPGCSRSSLLSGRVGRRRRRGGVRRPDGREPRGVSSCPASAGPSSVFVLGVGGVRKRRAGMPRCYDLLIAFAEPPAAQLVPIGIAGGASTAISPRTRRAPAATCSRPTSRRPSCGDSAADPRRMDGEPIRSGGDGSGLDRGSRRADGGHSRPARAGGDRSAWSPGSGRGRLSVGSSRGRGRAASAWLALAFAYMPLMLLVGAAIEPSALAEGLLVVRGGAAAALTLRLRSGVVGPGDRLRDHGGRVCDRRHRRVRADEALAARTEPDLRCPLLRDRNELEALFAVMVPVGVGAGLSAYSGGGRG